MQALYPIIRRQRRPLLVADAPPVVTGNVEAASAEGLPVKRAVEIQDVRDMSALPAKQEESN